MDYSVFLETITREIPNIESGQTFLVKDLFNGHIWEALPKSDRQNIGRMFKKLVKEKEFPEIVYIGKVANNSAQYKKIEIEE